MRYFKVFRSNGQFLRWVRDEQVAELWATAIDGYYQEVDLGGPDWRPE